MKPIERFLEQTERVSLLSAPTPLHRLTRFIENSDIPVYIKRDDLTGLGPGGNKVRSLEFLLGEAKALGCDTVLAAGPGQSNLCTLTAAACAKLGFSCELILNCCEPMRKEGNLLLNQLLKAQMYFLGDCSAEERTRYLENRIKSCFQEGRTPFAVRNGASTGRGALGYVAAIPELMDQCTNQGISNLTIFAPGGNGGVAAGLAYGNALMGSPFQIVIISVEDTQEDLREHIASVIAEIEQLTALPCPRPVEGLCQVVDDFRGGGWGINTRESERAVTDFARKEGIFVENVYTSKVLVGMEAWIQAGKIHGPACFLHTGGFGSLFSQY